MRRFSLTNRLVWRFCRLLTIIGVVAFGSVYFILQDYFDNKQRQDITSEMLEWEKIYYEEPSLKLLNAEIASELENEGKSRIHCRIVSSDGSKNISTPTDSWEFLPDIPKNIQPGHSIIVTFKNEGNNAMAIFRKLSDGTLFYYAIIDKDEQRFLTHYRQVSTWTLILALILSLPWIHFLIKKEIKGVDEVATVAENISATGRFNRKVSEEWQAKEIHQLAHSFNLMQQKIQNLLKELREVTNDVAHDLRSPLTRLRGVAETTLTGTDQSNEAYQEMAGNMVEECDRLVSLVNTMLEIAEAEAYSPKTSKVNLKKLVQDAGNVFEAVAEMKGIEFNTAFPDQDCFITGNESQLQRALGNLLDNAFKYSPGKSYISCSLQRTGKNFVICVKDTGIGVAPDEQEAIFHRFYRCDRSRTSSGNGLGLSYVKAVVQSHNGEVKVNSQLGEGSEFIVKLPI